MAVYPHRFRHHFSHIWLDRGGAEGDLMELNGWVSPQMLTRYGASARGAPRPPQLRPRHERHPLTPGGAPSERTGDGPRGTVLPRSGPCPNPPGPPGGVNPSCGPSRGAASTF